MSDPIMEKVAADMRQCAAKLIEFSKMYDAMVPTKYQWSAENLLHEAYVLTREPTIWDSLADE